MISCQACGSKLQTSANYCTFCGTFAGNPMDLNTLETLIDIITKQMEWMDSTKISDPLAIPASGKHPRVDELKNLELNELSEWLDNTMGNGNAGVFRSIDIELPIDCKPYNDGFLSTLNMKLGNNTVSFPVYTNSSVLTDNLTHLVRLVIATSIGGLLRGHAVPIKMEREP